jgi:hypothetical protein
VQGQRVEPEAQSFGTGKISVKAARGFALAEKPRKSKEKALGNFS